MAKEKIDFVVWKEQIANLTEDDFYLAITVNGPTEFYFMNFTAGVTIDIVFKNLSGMRLIVEHGSFVIPRLWIDNSILPNYPLVLAYSTIEIDEVIKITREATLETFYRAMQMLQRPMPGRYDITARASFTTVHYIGQRTWSPRPPYMRDFNIISNPITLTFYHPYLDL
ncbi:MAG: hypothetical protein FWD82_00460 [Defluviitaleaceae bacterium]|nr:hypothetical protein [Defluviitaleaceae bacterium]